MKKTKVKPGSNEPIIHFTNQFPVVGIGASAGGLDAFKKLLKAIPGKTGMAYVLVQHLAPTHESILPGLLQKVTDIPVVEISDNIKILPDHIYIIPSNKMLIANDGKLELSPRTATNDQPNLPIDIFFTSLANVYQTHSIGVILSGTASDGTQGLKAIKDRGGITFAQDEASAAFEGMPHSATQAGVVDFILPPEQIPGKLLEISRNYMNNAGNEIQQSNNDIFKQILTLLRVRKGTDFTYYKQTTIQRRILRRIALSNYGDPSAYMLYLRENKQEQDILYQDLLIPVTEFFRDTKTFDHLCQTILPHIFKNKTPGDPVRVWVAGCSTGEEAFSVAICIKEFLSNTTFPGWDGRRRAVQIFATDLNEHAITKARAGFYKKSDVENISPQRLKEFFIKSDGGYQVNKEVRDMCVFALHNFLKDPPFGKIDFISCRNVLIYMEPYLQKKALTTFHYSLQSRGFLLLGKTETISSVPDLFTVAAKNDNLFLRKDGAGKFMHVATQRIERNLQDYNVNPQTETISTDFQKAADDVIRNKYMPAGVVVNEAFDIVNFRGRTNDYLEQLEGKPSHNLLKLAKQGLSFDLRSILHKVKKEKAAVIKENISLQQNLVAGQNGDNARMISIEAIPLNTVEPHYLILFHETPNPEPPAKKISSRLKKDDKEIRIRALEQQLLQTHEDMRSITEEQEAANEELQSANEELLSSSEELQSLNEELETSKEELQSTNEELMVVQQEMSSLNEEVTEERDTAEAVLANIREPMLVLNKDLRIKKANPSFYKTFNMPESHIEGQLIYDLGNNEFNIPSLRKLLEEILPQRIKVINYEIQHSFPGMGERTLQLNAHEIVSKRKSENLIMLSIEDITAFKKDEDANAMLAAIIESSGDAIISKTLAGIITSWNRGAEEVFGYKANEIIGQSITKIIPKERLGEEPEIIRKIQAGETIAHFETQRLHKHGKLIDISLTISPIKDNHGNITGASKIARDITEQIEARKKIEESEQRFHNLIFSSPSGIGILYGEDMVITIANEPIIEIWGKGKEIIGKKYFKALPELAEQGYREIFESVYKTGIPFNAIETPVQILQNGKDTLKYYNFILYPQRNINKEIIGIGIIASEVTSQALINNNIKESEERFRSLTQSLPQLIWVTDADGNSEFISSSWIEYAGIEPKTDKDWKEILHAEDYHAFTEAKALSLTTENIYTADVRLKNRGGNYRWHTVKGAPVFNNEKKIIKWIGAFTDIHDQKIKEEQKDEFISIASHEMKTPLTTAKAYLQMLELSLDENDEDTNLYAKKASQAVSRLNELIGELLDVSKIRLGKLNYTISTFNFNDMINSTVENMQLTSPIHTIIKKGKVKADVTGDKERLQQVVINLLSNAIKYSPGEDKVYITVSQQMNTIKVSVKDTGIGIAAPSLQKIFDKYHRVEEHAVHFQGLGIGLFISYEIIQRHNGKLWAESEEGKGSTFYFTLPVSSDVNQ